MSSRSIFHHFVDDTNLVFPSEKLGTIKYIINNKLKHVAQRLRGNGLSLIETKIELIILRLAWKQILHEPYIRLNNCKLKWQTHVK